MLLAMSDWYKLPSSPDIRHEDRFSILDSDDLVVPFWDIFKRLLQQPVSDAATLINMLELVAVTRHGTARTGYGFLKAFMERELCANFFSQVWPGLVSLALSMPDLFPSHRILVCILGSSQLVLSRRQVACLVIHQFLCTLVAPRWQDNFQDIHTCNSLDQVHSSALNAYLKALFAYFDRIADHTGFSPLAYDLTDWPISYALQSGHAGLPEGKAPLSALEVLNLSEASTALELLGLPDGAAVISANKLIGFEQTGTQEETHVGASPEACLAVLVTPPLADDQVMVVRGPEAMVSIVGYGREARYAELLTLSASPLCHREKLARRTMLFMDALELDLESNDEGLPDLAPGNVQRELLKACVAFQSGRSRQEPYSAIYTGYWGCGSFGGNVEVKALIQWCAASIAGCPLRFVSFAPMPSSMRLGKFLKLSC